MSLFQRAQRARTPTPCTAQRRQRRPPNRSLRNRSGGALSPDRCVFVPPSPLFSCSGPDPHRCVSVPEKSWCCRAGAPRAPCLAQHSEALSATRRAASRSISPGALRSRRRSGCGTWSPPQALRCEDKIHNVGLVSRFSSTPPSSLTSKVFAPTFSSRVERPASLTLIAIPSAAAAPPPARWHAFQPFPDGDRSIAANRSGGVLHPY